MRAAETEQFRALSVKIATAISVLADAYVQWDFMHQCWEIQNVFDKGHHCEDCDGACSIEDEEADDV
jgi:hypothetical protein